MNTEMVAPECIEKGDFIWSKQDVYEGRVKNNYSYLQPKTHADVKAHKEINTTMWVFTLEHGPEFSFSSGEQVKRRCRQW